MKQKSAVIGSGVAGIASAIRLAAKGYLVQVFEQASGPGGKLSERRHGGFRFDTGPSLFTLPELVTELFELCGKDPRNYFTCKLLDASCRYFWEDGTVINAWHNSDDFAKEVGVQFHFNTAVESVRVQNRRATGLRAGGKDVDFDLIVSDVDVVNFYKKLLPAHPLPKKLLSHERSSSALIFYWGVNKNFPELSLHNILFSKDYEKEFRHLFSEKSITGDPTVYIFISAREVPDDAPTGQENWYVMINAPENTGQEWDSMVCNARKHIVSKIKRILGVDIERHIVTESHADPRSIENDTGSYNGSLYGLSSNNKFAAFYRHPNFKHSIKTLYFTGGSVHPGGGIPLCLASAKIIDKEISAI